MAVFSITASFFGRGALSGPWPPAPIMATPGVPGVPGVPQPLKPYGETFGISCDPGFASAGPPGDPVVLALQAALQKSYGPGPH
jgi:hypothetical protein